MTSTTDHPTGLNPVYDRTREPKQKNDYFEDYLIDDESGDTMNSKFILTYLKKSNGSMEVIELIVKTDAKSPYIKDDVKDAVRRQFLREEVVFDCEVTLTY